MSAGRPRVLVNFAASIDGKIAVVPSLRTGVFKMSRHPEDHRRMQALRARAQAIVIGGGNMRADDPALALAPDERQRRRAAGESEPLRIVVTRRGEGVTPQRRMFDPARGGASVVVHSEALAADLAARLAPVARLVPMGRDAVDVPRLLAWLAGEMGVTTLLCEGGGVLCSEMFAARAVDELFVTLVPRILGGAEAPSLAAGPGFGPDEIPDAKLAAVERVGDELYLRYEFSWSPAG